MPALESAKLEHIAFYPVQSCGGIEVEEALLTVHGLQVEEFLDCSFLIVNASVDDQGTHQLITPGQADLHSIRSKLISCLLTLNHSDSHQIEVPNTDLGRRMAIGIGDGVEMAIDQGDMLESWLSAVLNLPAKLVKPVEIARHPIYWCISESLGVFSSQHKLRPNLEVSGMSSRFEQQPFQGQIAGIPFVNQPISSFGGVIIPWESGLIKVGDELVVKSYRNPPLVYGAPGELV